MKALLTTILIFSFLGCYSQDLKTVRYDGSNLQDFINNLPNNSRVVFDGGDVIREGTLIIKNKENIQFVFNGFKIKSNTKGNNTRPRENKRRLWPRNRSHIFIENSSGISIDSLIIEGPHINGGTSEKAYVSSLEAQHAIEILYSNDIDISRCHLSNIFGDGVYIGKDSKRIKVHNCLIEKNGRQGIAVSDAIDVEIYENSFREIRRAHIDLECNMPTDVINRITIRNNTFGTKRLKWIAAASSKGRVKNVTVKDNLINCPADIVLGNVKNEKMQGPYNFINNKSTKSYGNPQGEIWKLRNVVGFYAEGNRIIAQRKRNMHLVGAKNSTEIELVNNEVPNGLAEVAQ